MSFKKRQATLWLYLQQLRKTGWLTDADNYHHTKMTRPQLVFMLLIAIKSAAIKENKSFRRAYEELWKRGNRILKGCKISEKALRGVYATNLARREAYRREQGLPDDSGAVAPVECFLDKARKEGILAKGDDPPVPDDCKPIFRVPEDWEPSDSETKARLDATQVTTIHTQ